MRTAATLAALIIVLAACAASPTPPTVAPSSATPTAVAMVTPTTAAPTPSSSAKLTAVSARVTFDGQACAYTGPTVIPFPATLSIEFAPTAGVADSWVGVVAVRSGTTTAQVEDPSNPPVGAAAPAFAYEDTHMFFTGAGNVDYRAVPSGGNPLAEPGPDGKPYDTFAVMCLRTIPGSVVGGVTMLRVVTPNA
jgi:hypothetical protein